jgi:alkanesulfonate monooxygenase SsuD/methylene tetrahydromethanopterin reductase-like flavin-dependent oxidoreductase (luciferase family)
MRIGISVQSAYRVDDPAQGVRHMLERAEAASQADLDSLFVGDHHVTGYAYYQNSPILGRMLAHWHGKPAGALYLLPLWHPVLLAEQISTLAAIMPGRFIMQCGLGGLPDQSAGMGIDMSQRVAMFEDSLAIMRQLWAGETVSHDRFWHLENAHIAPLPAQDIEVWIGATAPAAINRTARLAEGWLGTPSATPQQAKEQLNQYRQACAEHQRTPSAVALRRDIFIAGSVNEAEAFRSHAVAKGYRGFPEEALICGDVSQVAAQFAEFSEAGFTDIVVRNMSSDQGQALATIEALSDVRRQLNL